MAVCMCPVHLHVESLSNFYCPRAGEDDIEGYETMLAVEANEYETMVVGNSGCTATDPAASEVVENVEYAPSSTPATMVENVAYAPSSTPATMVENVAYAPTQATVVEKVAHSPK